MVTMTGRGLPEAAVAQVHRWCAERVPEKVRARFHYTRSADTWTLYYRDRNLRFHRYDPAPPSADIGTLLAEVDRDPTGLFWG